MMTQQEAKELSIEVWQYLADYPEITSKEERKIYAQAIEDKIKAWKFKEEK
jgi:hypothetical protein